MKVTAVVDCPCCQGKGKLNIYEPTEEADWLLELEFKRLELKEEIKEAKDKEYPYFIYNCISCGMPYVQLFYKREEHLRFCKHECQAAYYERNKQPLYAEFSEEVKK